MSEQKKNQSWAQERTAKDRYFISVSTQSVFMALCRPDSAHSQVPANPFSNWARRLVITLQYMLQMKNIHISFDDCRHVSNRYLPNSLPDSYEMRHMPISTGSRFFSAITCGTGYSWPGMRVKCILYTVGYMILGRNAHLYFDVHLQYLYHYLYVCSFRGYIWELVDP